MEFEVLTVRAKVQRCANHIITISVKPPRARQPEQRFCNSMLLYSCHSYPLIHASPHTKALRAQTSDQGTVIIKLIKTEGAHHQSSPAFPTWLALDFWGNTHCPAGGPRDESSRMLRLRAIQGPLAQLAKPRAGKGIIEFVKFI